MTTLLNKSEILNLLNDGWKPRIKKAKGNEYISLRRRSKEKELSLGRKSDELWDFIQANKPKSEIEKLRIQIQELENKINIIVKENSNNIVHLMKEFDTGNARRGATTFSRLLEWKVTQCTYTTTYLINTFCSKYFWNKKPSDIIKRFPKATFKRSAMGFDSANRKWRFIPHPDICGLCNPIDNLFSKFNENAYENLERLRVEVAKISKFISFLEETSRRRVRKDYPNGNCIHLEEDGYCTYWTWKKQRWDRTLKQKDGKWCDNVRVHPIICVACPSYWSKEQEKRLETKQ